MPHLTKIVGVAAGGGHSLFLQEDGAVLACGANAHGQCGLCWADRVIAFAWRPEAMLLPEGAAGAVVQVDPPNPNPSPSPNRGRRQP